MHDLRSSVVFCDGIRLEASGKLLLIGVYGADLVILDPALPLALAAQVTFKGLPPAPPPQVSVRARIGDEVLATAQVDVEEVRAGHAAILERFAPLLDRLAAEGAGGLLYGGMVLELVIPPGLAPGVLVVEADTGDGMRIAGSLVLGTASGAPPA